MTPAFTSVASCLALLRNSCIWARGTTVSMTSSAPADLPIQKARSRASMSEWAMSFQHIQVHGTQRLGEFAQQFHVAVEAVVVAVLQADHQVCLRRLLDVGGDAQVGPARERWRRG